MSFQKAAEELRANEGAMLADIAGLIGIPSVTGNGAENERALAFVCRHAEALGFSAKILLGGRVAAVECGDCGETVGILAHVDVVPPGDAGEWSGPPFSGRVRDGCLFGRGAVDDKGPLIAALYAMRAAKNAAGRLNKRFRMVVGTSEEGSWDEMRQYTAQYPLPDYGFTPDGEFPLTNIEKGYADVVLSAGCENSGEGAFRVVGLSGGDSVNTVPDSAEALLEGDPAELERCLGLYGKSSGGAAGLRCTAREGKLRVSARGRRVHSSTPERGENAVVRLLRFIHTLPLACPGASALAECVGACFGGVYGEGLGFPVQSEWQDGEFVHRTTAVPTRLTCSDGKIRLNINLRTRLGTARDEVGGIFEALAQKYGLAFSIEEWQDPLYLSKKEPFVKLLAQSYGEVTGSTELFGLACGTSYAKAMPRHVSFGPLFPGQDDYSHRADERISVGSLMKAAEIYALALYRVGTAGPLAGGT